MEEIFFFNYQRGDKLLDTDGSVDLNVLRLRTEIAEALELDDGL